MRTNHLVRLGAMNRLQRQRHLVKRKMRTQIDRRLGSRFSLFSEIFGKPIRPDMVSKDRVKLRKKAERWVDNAFDTFGTNWNSISLNEKRKKLAVFLDGQFRLFGRVPKGTNALVWYRKQMEDAVMVRAKSDFAVSYNRYSKATCWLVRDLFKMEQINVAQEFFVQFAKSEEGFSLAQLFAQQLLPGYASLERLESKHLDSRDIHRLVKLYLTYSGAFERLEECLWSSTAYGG